MYIAKHYFETRFKRTFHQGEVVPDEIAKFYPRDVIEKGGELLVDDSSDVSTFTSFEDTSNSLTTKNNTLINETVENNSNTSKTKETNETIEIEDEETEESLKARFKSKKKLEEYARTKGIELDRRKTLSHMIKDYLRLKNKA